MIDIHSDNFERVFLSSPVIIDKINGEIYISGVALSVGTWKDVFYCPEELKKVADKLKGIPVKINHQQDTHVGEVVSSEWNELVKAILFRAKINRGFPITEWDGVSCGTWMQKKEENGKIMGYSFKIDELSLTNTPADPNAIIITKEQLSSAMPDQGKGEQKMEKKDEQHPKLFAIVELNSMEEADELRKKSPYVHVYYGETGTIPFYYKNAKTGEFYPYFPDYKEPVKEEKVEPDVPFGDYANFQDCIDKNQGQAGDPGAYCMAIKQKILGSKNEVLSAQPAKEPVKEVPKEAPKEVVTPLPLVQTVPIVEVPKEDPVKKEIDTLKQEVENLRKSVQLSLDATKAAELSKEKAVKDAVEQTKTKILTDVEKTLPSSGIVFQWKSMGAQRLVDDVKKVIHKHKEQ
jgi:hypothetical protein